jgi:CxxC motif-containing protein
MIGNNQSLYGEVVETLVKVQYTANAVISVHSKSKLPKEELSALCIKEAKSILKRTFSNAKIDIVSVDKADIIYNVNP